MTTQNNLSLLIPAKAKDAQAKLLTALGTENNKGQWMLFMQTVTELLPQILKEGRPKAEDISASFIGQLGFKSWQAMLEAPASENGLSWNVSAWRAWRRAWSVVQANQWLLEAGLSSSEVNTLATEQKREDFPKSLEEYEKIKEGRSEALEHARANAVTKLKQQAKDAETAAQAAQAQAQEAQAQAKLLSAINKNYEAKEQSLINDLVTIKAEKAELLAQVQTLTAQLNALTNENSLSLLKRLFRSLFNA